MMNIPQVAYPVYNATGWPALPNWQTMGGVSAPFVQPMPMLSPNSIFMRNGSNPQTDVAIQAGLKRWYPVGAYSFSNIDPNTPLTSKLASPVKYAVLNGLESVVFNAAIVLGLNAVLFKRPVKEAFNVIENLIIAGFAGWSATTAYANQKRRNQNIIGLVNQYGPLNVRDGQRAAMIG